MSIRTDAVGDSILRTATVPGSDPITLMCWLYLVNDRNAVGSIMYVTDAVANAIVVRLSTDGTTLQCDTIVGNVDNVVSGTNLSIGRWYHIARVRSGSIQQVFLDGVFDSGETRADTVPTARLEAMNDLASQWTDGRIFNFQVFTEAFTAEKIKQHMQMIRPPQRENLWAWYPMFPGANNRLKDYSGNGRDLTAAGTLTDEADPPIPWSRFDATSELFLMEAPFVTEQEGYRFGRDTAGESSPDWMAAQDTPTTVERETNFRLRTLSNGLSDPDSQPYPLEYKKPDSLDWRRVQ